MDATVYLTAMGMGVAAPNPELEAALKELRAALASKDQVWQRRAQNRVDRAKGK